MLEQEQNRAQDAQRFEQTSAWVFQQGRTVIEHVDAIMDEAARELLAERLRTSSFEVAAQGELNDLQAAAASARSANERMETRVSELMAAGRDVTDSRDRLWDEVRSARNNRQAEQSELQAQHVRAWGISSEE
eukprot:3425282-Amphidinium_carterae.1